MGGIISTGKAAITLGQYMNRKLTEYQDEKGREYFNAILENYRNGSCSAEDFEQIIEEKLQSSIESRDAFIKLLTFSYRSLLDSVDDRVLPALARLTAGYMEKLTAGNIPHVTGAVDPFFRGMCRTLSDLTGDQYFELQKLSRHFDKMPNSMRFLYLDYRPGSVTYHDQHGTPDAGLSIHEIGPKEERRTAHLGEFKHILSICHLLITNGFEHKPERATSHQSAYGSVLIWLEGGLAKRIASIVLPA